MEVCLRRSASSLAERRLTKVGLQMWLGVVPPPVAASSDGWSVFSYAFRKLGLSRSSQMYTGSALFRRNLGGKF